MGLFDFIGDIITGGGSGAQKNAANASADATKQAADLLKQGWKLGEPLRNQYLSATQAQFPWLNSMRNYLQGPMSGFNFAATSVTQPAQATPISSTPLTQTPATGYVPTTTPATPQTTAAPSTLSLQQWVASRKDIIPEVWARMTPEQQLVAAQKMGYVPQAAGTGTTPQGGGNPAGYDSNYHPAASGNDQYVTPGGAHGYRPGGQAAWNETPQGQQAWQSAAEGSVPWWMQNKEFDASTMPALPGTNYASQLSSTPDPEAEAAKIQASYDTLNGLNLQDYKRNLEDTLGSSLARRGITDSSGAINGLAGIDNWAAVQGARDKAEGLMAARQWAQGLRNENNNLVGTKRDWANGDYNTSMQNLLTKTSLQQQAQDRAAQNWYAMNSLVQGANDALGSYMNPSSYASGVGSLANNYANLANMYGNAGQGISSLFGALGSLYANKSQPQNTTIKIGSDLNGFNGQGSWLKTPSLTNYFG